MSSPLPPLPKVEQLSPRVIRILGGNPGKFTLQGTNTYLLGTGASRLLIDTGAGHPSWLTALRTLLTASHLTIATVLLTHAHADHTGGVADLLALCPLAQIHQHTAAAPARLALQDGQMLRVEGAALRAVHAPGHTADHVAFVLEEEGALFSGDAVLGHGTVVFADLGAYVQTLERLRGEFAGRCYPGHGDVVVDGVGRVEEYLVHRKRREEQVLGVLSAGERGVSGVREVVYPGLGEEMWAVAERGVRLVLEKLRGEGKVLCDEAEGTWRVVGGRSAL
ncbi:MAG: hypothetical protein M1829_004817 [Trizodia sp. TS-e1964]|nr:MAG: hypothetical protein M1829_004817 [Trizodia sp. TS-e1964]